jgi:hypothetical protein
LTPNKTLQRTRKDCADDTKRSLQTNMMKPSESVFNTNAARLRGLRARVHETFRKEPHGPEHIAACAEFHDAYDELAMPGGLDKHLALLQEGDKQAVSEAIAFLSADPRFFRSGYTKEKILRRLKHVSLTERQQQVLVGLIARSVDRGGRREFHGYARLSGVLGSGDIEKAMESRLASRDPEVERRAKEVLHVLESKRSQR